MAYIDRDKLIKELSTMYKSPTSAEDFMTVGYDHAIADVVITAYKHPTADVVERKRGEWIPILEVNENGEPYQAGAYCSECGDAESYEPYFCPNCGADMR